MFIKKLFLIILALILAISISGCSGSNVDFDEPALQAKAEAVVENMLADDFEAATAGFNNEMAELLPASELEASWDTVVAPLGEYQEHYQTSGEAQNNYYIVQVISRFELNSVVTSVTFDASGNVAGLWMNYYTIESGPIETDEFKEISLAVGEYQLPGILTVPTGGENPPVVLLVSGSGATDMNGTIGAAGNTVLRDIAHGLANHGIATLRYDDRYYAHPELANDEGAMTIEAEVLDDVYAAIGQLAIDSRVDSSRIYVLGHSLGGMLVPKIAAESNQLAGVISLAGSLRNLAEISLDQNIAAAEAIRTNLSAEEEKQLDAQLEKAEAEVSAILALKGDDGKTYLTLPASYWYSLNQAVGLNYIDQLDIPILILQGSEDFQVYPQTDYALWQEYLADDPNATLVLYQGLNHLFMESDGSKTIAEYDAPNTVNQEVIDDIASWIN